MAVSKHYACNLSTCGCPDKQLSELPGTWLKISHLSSFSSLREEEFNQGGENKFISFKNINLFSFASIQMLFNDSLIGTDTFINIHKILQNFKMTTPIH